MASMPLRTPDDDPDLHGLRLSAQRALLGNIGAHLRAVAVSYRGQTIVFDALVDPEATDEEREDLEDAAHDVIADYPLGWLLEVNVRSGADDLPQWPARVFQRTDASLPPLDV
jgi:hypothetical protein